MTTFLLIRHAAHTLGPEVLTGRTRGIHLSPDGRAAAGRLADRLAPLPIRAIYTTPAERTQETAAPLAQRLGLDARATDALHEIDFGDWTGLRFDELRARDDWRRWNSFRGGVRPPRGEAMAEVQARVVAELLRLRDRHPDAWVALFTHGDIIRAALTHFLGLHLDHLTRIEIDLASVSIIRLGEGWSRILCINHTPDLPTD